MTCPSRDTTVFYNGDKEKARINASDSSWVILFLRLKAIESFFLTSRDILHNFSHSSDNWLFVIRLIDL